MPDNPLPSDRDEIKAAIDDVLLPTHAKFDDEDDAALADEKTEKEIERLAGLGGIAYERERAEAADRLGLGVGALDRLVRDVRRDDNAEGRRVWEPRRAEPIPHGKTAPAGMLDELAAAARQYLHLPVHGDTLIALWVAHTYVFKCQPHTPRLAITSATRGCGKTSVLDFLEMTCQAPLASDSCTAAAVFRLVEEHSPTLLLDELDNRFSEADDLRRILNSGWQRGRAAHRVEAVNGQLTVACYETHSPAALAAIGRLPTTLEDRAIALRMERARPGELKARLRTDRPEDWDDLRARLATFAAGCDYQLHAANPTMPGAFNRVADRWRILVAIADVAQHGWPERAREAMRADIVSSQEMDDGDVAVLLLSDIRDIFTRIGERIEIGELAATLIALPDRPWGEWSHGRAITTRGVGKLIARFGIVSKQLRIGADRSRGYHADQFTEVWRRYIPESNRDTVTSRGNPRVSGISETVTAPPVSRFENDAKPLIEKGCHGVTVSYPEGYGNDASVNAQAPAQPGLPDRPDAPDAVVWLKAELANGPVAMTAIQEAAQAGGVGWLQLCLAKAALLVDSIPRADGGQDWHLPKGIAPEVPIQPEPDGAAGTWRDGSR